MPNDLMPFLIGVGLLIVYLIGSALTEMGTRWPWTSRRDRNRS